MKLSLVAVVLPALATAFVPCARADFIIPDGVNYQWIRGATPNSAYAEWNIFTSPSGPNAPDVGSYAGGFLPGGAPPWNVYDASGQSIVTGGGNIYSFAAPTNIHVVAPNLDLGALYTTTVLLQVRTQGTEILPSSVNIGGVAPTQATELFRQSLGGMGFLVDTLYRWELPGNGISYEIRFDAAESSMSLDRVAVDTFTTPAACAPDCNGDGALNLSDFGCFQTKFAIGDPYADCNGDGVRNLSDFGCFQTKFAIGCP